MKHIMQEGKGDLAYPISLFPHKLYGPAGKGKNMIFILQLHYTSKSTKSTLSSLQS